MKEGVKTSEFWLPVGVAVISVMNAVLGLGMSDATIAAVAGTVVAYIASRGYLKASKPRNGPPKKDFL